MADDVQPEQGQGAAPYADYLNQIPEDYRAQVEPVFKEWDASVTKKFMEAAEFRRQMEPFQQFQGRDADALRWGAEFHDAAVNNPQAVVDWAKEYAKEHGLTLAEQQAVEQAVEEFEDPALVALKSRLDPITDQLQALTQRFEQQDHQARLIEAQQAIDTQMTEAKDRLGDLFNQDAIEGLIGKYIETDPEHAVEYAARDWEQIANGLKTAAIQGKLDTTIPAPETGGVPDGSIPKVSTFEQAAELVRQRLSQQ